MALTAGARLGSYEITFALGAGGMGEVYRAKDTKLGRDVALKILPASFTNDPERVARFRREAQVLASLNHPHIGQIYGLEEANGTQFLVLELVDGESLDKRIARGPIPVDEALGMAKQIAEALEAAHEKGIIHRDLKPANIAVTKDAQVKVLDFGLAKAVETTSGPAFDAMNSPTITSPAMMTGVGVILGTAAYMAPEQLKGKRVDKRSDVWAYGCVLYEMLTGRQAFKGEDVSDTQALIITKQPDWTALPTNTPATIRTLVRRCLEKDRARRLADAADGRLEIEDAIATPASIDQPLRSVTRRRALVIAFVLGLSIGAIAGGIVVSLTKRPLSAHVARMTISAPSGPYTHPRLAISPDGTRFAYITLDIGNRIVSRLLLRSISSLEASTLVEDRGGRSPEGLLGSPFFSPDGQWVGFFQAGALKKVSITGGPVVTIGPVMGFPLGATWGRDDAVIFAATEMSPSGLWRISARGGTPAALTTPNLERETQHAAPEFLPNGQSVLFAISPKDTGASGQVAVLDLRTGRYKVVVRGGTDAHYVSSGHLVYRVGETLHAVAFDLERMEAVGPSTPVLESVAVAYRSGSTTALPADVAVAANGTLIYVPAGMNGMARTLVWLDRHGVEEPISAPARAYTYPRLSPDGMRVALDVRDQENDIWTWNFAHNTLTRFTSDPGLDRFPVWTPDGRRLVFSSDRAGPANVCWQLADGTGTVERLTQSPQAQLPTSVSPDGTELVVRVNAPGSTDLMAVNLGLDHKVRPLVQTAFNENNGEVSPDGRWLAYQSNDSGQNEIYVRPFPNSEAGRSQVSTDGGMQPLWARNGRELFYLAPTGALMSVRVERATIWSADTPTKLFDSRYYFGTAVIDGRTYDISRDGQRFLMIKPSPGFESGTTYPTIVVVFNWTEELKRLVPAK